MSSETPFEISVGGTSGFVAFELGPDRLALPLISIQRVTLTGDKSISITWDSCLIRIEGSGLSALYELLIDLRVKTVRCGVHERCRVVGIRHFDE